MKEQRPNKHVTNPYHNKKSQTRYRWLIGLFIIMITMTTVINYLHAELKLFETAYEQIQVDSSQKTANKLSKKEPITILIVATQYFELGQLENEGTGSLFTVTINPKGNHNVIVQLDPDIEISDGRSTETIKLKSLYQDRGIQETKVCIETILQRPIDYSIVIKLDKLRPFVEELKGLDLPMIETLSLEDKVYQKNQHYHLSGRLIEKYIIQQSDELVITHSLRIVSLLGSLFQRVYQWDEIFNWKYYLESAISFLKTDISCHDFKTLVLKQYLNVTIPMEVITITQDTMK